MWRPSQDLETFNRLLVKLEQAYLAVLRKTGTVDAFLASADLDALFQLVDENPYQAVAMARIKSGHTMTPRHGINVMLLLRAWGITSHRLGSRLADLSLAGLLHDLGHWRPDHLVYVFEYFSTEEYGRMKGHVAATLAEAPLSQEALSWIEQHHEQPDGRGYPKGITNPSPLAQLIRLCDCYDGLTTARRFRPAYTSHRAMQLMSRWAGFKFADGLFQSFFQFMGGLHPFGSFVKLRDGSMGVVLPPHEGHEMVLVLTNVEGDAIAGQEPRPLEASEVVDEGFQWQQIKIPDGWRNVRPDLLNLPRYY